MTTTYFVPHAFPFVDDEHKEFFEFEAHEIGTTYGPSIAAIYLLSATPETRASFWELVELDGDIARDCPDGWADPESQLCAALAVALAHGKDPAPLGDITGGPLGHIRAAALDYCHRCPAMQL